MVFPFLVILPGMIAIAVPRRRLGFAQQRRVAPRRCTAQIGSPRPAVVQRSLIPPKLDAGNADVDTDGRVALDYDLAIPMMLVHYFPAACSASGYAR